MFCTPIIANNSHTNDFPPPLGILATGSCRVKIIIAIVHFLLSHFLNAPDFLLREHADGQIARHCAMFS